MDSTNGLTVIAPSSLREAEELAGTLAKAKTMPTTLHQSPADCLAVILTGAELGLAPMQSVRALTIIKGKPTLAADAMGALVRRRRDVCQYLICRATDAKSATFETRREGDPQATTLSFTMDQARAAGLTVGENWRKYPEAMLRARALSAICRLVYPDLLLGVYDPDELQTERAETEVNAPPKAAPVIDAVVTSAKPVPPPPASPPRPAPELEVVPAAAVAPSPAPAPKKRRMVFQDVVDAPPVTVAAPTPTPVDELRAAIAAANSPTELAALVGRLRARPPEDRDALRPAYEARLKEVSR